ncbi:MAG TPA: L,D-transpeptidase family protein [Flavisolibacter sp.]|nr:L,D-transpeptidase family protein [Flavisolibacter sp.]
MKKMIIAIAVISCLSSCTQVAGWFGSNEDSTRLESPDSIEVYRDVSINESNAYSDLFLDSSAIESFIKSEGLKDSAAKLFRDFYTVRNGQYAWFASGGPTEQARGLWGLYSNQAEAGKDKGDDSLRKRMDSLLADSTALIADSSVLLSTELALTRQLIDLALTQPEGAINRSTIFYLVPAKRQDAMQLADSLLNRQKDSSAYASNKLYQMMKTQLALYYDLARNGGWAAITGPVNASKGSRQPQVKAIKKRLQATREYDAADTTDIFSDSLQSAIRRYQERNGLQASGMINDSLLSSLNVSAEDRLKQILVNMNRILWSQPTTDSSYLQVNIPSFMLYAFENGRPSLQMPVIVGKEGANTMMFSGNINKVVFSPYWNIPESIVRNEIMPAMKKDPGYLKKHNMERTGGSDSLPVLRQLPGKDNALGKVKFLFPNSFDIYLHDTPNKSLFARNDRALSHGCIRVADATRLAQYILQDEASWTPEKISAAMNANKEQTVEIRNTHPVHITYLTAWVDDQGFMNFRPDVYGHDGEAMTRMFVAAAGR